MHGRENKFLFVLLLLIGTLFGNVIGQFFTQGNVNPASFLGAVSGVALGVAIHWYVRKRPNIRFAGVVLIAMIMPLPIAGLGTFLFSLFQVTTTVQVFLSIYFLGFLIILFIAIRPGSKMFFQEVPTYDERQMSHFYRAGAWSFLFLFVLVMSALVQPWIDLGQPGLWVGILGIGLLFWVINVTFLELKK